MEMRRRDTEGTLPGGGSQLGKRQEQPTFVQKGSRRGRRAAPAWLGWLLAVALIGQAAAGPQAAANALVHEADLPFGPATAAAWVDVDGDGQSELVLTGPEGLAVFAPPPAAGDATTWLNLAQLPALPSPPTAVGSGDVTGDGVPELVVGTANAGAVYVFAWTGRRWTLLGQTPYLWSPVSALAAGDPDGDGRDELVVLSEAGELVVLGWRERVWQVLWRSPAGWSPVLHFQLADLGGDGRPGLIVTDQASAVTVWRWPMTEPAAQAFVWGTPVSLAVDLHTAGAPQVLVATDERLLYRYTWQDQQLVPAGTPLYDTRLPFDFMQPVRWRGEPRVSVASQYAGGLGLWRVTPSTLELWASGPPLALRWLLADGDGERLIVGERARPVSVWSRRPADYLAFSVNGAPWALQDPPVVQGEHVLISMRDWASLLGLSLHWEAAEQRLTARGAQGFIVLVIGAREAFSHAGPVPLAVAPVLRSGRTYGPPEVAAAFGASVSWDPRRRELAVTLPH